MGGQGIFPRWLGLVALASAAGGLVTGLMNIASTTRAPLVLDLGSFLLSCVFFFSGVSVAGLLMRRKVTARSVEAVEPPMWWTT